jgi:hypothetical protein
MRPDHQAPLTLDEHREMSRELRRTNGRLRELHGVVTAIYGKGHQAASSFAHVVESMDRLCKDMQSQVERDYPGIRTNDLYG